MSKDFLLTLLEDLKNAKEGSRELSDGCLLAIGWERTKIVNWLKDGRNLYIWKHPNWKNKILDHGNQPDPSRDTQDTLDWMVPEGIEIFIYLANHKEAVVQFGMPRSQPFSEAEVEGDDALARAFCLARVEQLIGECDEN